MRGRGIGLVIMVDAIVNMKAGAFRIFNEFYPVACRPNYPGGVANI